LVRSAAPGERSELRGHRQQLAKSAALTQPSALTIFAVVTRAREVGRAMPTDLLDLLGPPGRCSGCWPHDGEVAGGAIAF
jgi:hypothetical protein